MNLSDNHINFSLSALFLCPTLIFQFLQPLLVLCTYMPEIDNLTATLSVLKTGNFLGVLDR